MEVLKGVLLAVCRMKCIDLCNEAIKTLGTYFSYNNTMKEEYNFLKVAFDVQTVVCNGLAISKIVFQALITAVSSHIIKALETVQTFFL